MLSVTGSVLLVPGGIGTDLGKLSENIGVCGLILTVNVIPGTGNI